MQEGGRKSKLTFSSIPGFCSSREKTDFKSNTGCLIFADVRFACLPFEDVATSRKATPKRFNHGMPSWDVGFLPGRETLNRGRVEHILISDYP